MKETGTRATLKPTEIRKNASEVIRVEATTYKGFELVGLRVFVDAGNGEYRPTKKGITFRQALLPKIIAALTELSAELGLDGDPPE
jgi:hypothetical protein